MTIEDKIKDIRTNKKIGLMGHIVAGFPDIKTSLNAALGICEGGADFLEVQFPFSDPTADGSTIEGACYTALSEGFKVDGGFGIVKKLTDSVDIPVFIMTYANIVYRYDIEKFIMKAKESGCSGLIIPDMPLDNDEGLNELCIKHRIANIFVVAPGADKMRIKELSQAGSGLLYTVARRGITGRKTQISGEVEDWIKFVKNNSSLPIATGFGIQSKEQIKELVGKSDIAVVGSFFVNAIRDAVKNGEDVNKKLFSLTKNLID